jgi:1-acyl-sn-glycerol-3-phosphate acyltransferase
MRKLLIYLLNPIKLLLSICLTIIISTLVLLLFIFFKKGSLSFIRLQRIWGKILLGIFRVKVIIEGQEKIDQEPGHIYISNHSSYLDIFILGAKLPGKIAFLGKKELNRIPIFGWAWQITGNISINRKNPKAFMRSLNAAAEEVRNNRSVIIFPEGTRTKDGRIQSFKRGFSIVAIKSKAKIYPITINGAYKLCKTGSLVVLPGVVRIIIHDPIVPDYSQNRKIIENIVMDNARKKIESSYHLPE